MAKVIKYKVLDVMNEYRYKNKVGRHEIAEKLGIKLDCFYSYISKPRYTFEQLEGLADIFECEIEELYEVVEENKINGGVKNEN